MCTMTASGRVAAREQLTRGAAGKPKTAAEAVPRAEGPEADVAGRSCRPTESHRTVTDSHRRGERANEIDGLCEHGVVGVDGLGDEDEPHLSEPFRRPPPRRARASPRRAVRESNASRRSGPWRQHPSARRAPGRRARAPRRPPAQSVSAGGTSSPSTSFVTRSGMPPPSVATTARPRANDSMITRPRPSGQDGRTSTVAASSCAETASGSSHSWCSTGREVRRRACRRPPAASRADDHERGVRQPIGDDAPRGGEPFDVLVRLERSDE